MSKPVHEDQKIQLRAKPSRKYYFQDNKISFWRPWAPIEGETPQKKRTSTAPPMKKIDLNLLTE